MRALFTIQKVTTKDIIWLAGWLEGEGAFGLHREGRAKTPSPTISFSSTDADVVERVRGILGIAPRRALTRPRDAGRYYHGAKPCWNYHLGGARAAGWMMTLYPLMGLRRRQAITRALTVWRSRPMPQNSLNRLRRDYWGAQIPYDRLRPSHLKGTLL